MASGSESEIEPDQGQANSTPIKPEDFLTIIDSSCSKSPYKTESDQSFADIQDGGCQVEVQDQAIALQKV